MYTVYIIVIYSGLFDPVGSTMLDEFQVDEGLDFERLSTLNMVRYFRRELRAVVRGQHPHEFLGKRVTDHLRDLDVLRYSQGRRRLVVSDWVLPELGVRA